MQLTPRYGTPPVISVELRSDGPHPVVGQRRRLEAVLRELSDEQWQQPSRCDGWTVQDVVTHLTTTNGFWALSISQGLAGEPTRFLASFDPVASPAQMVDDIRGRPAGDTLDEFARSNAALAECVEALDDVGWAATGEAPPGHLRISEVADHAVWDAWVHERDIAIPLGLKPTVEADEVRTCLHYAVTLGRAMAIGTGSTEVGAVEIVVTDPADRFVVEAGPSQVRVHAGDAPIGCRAVEADAVTLLEVLSRRNAGWPEPPEVAWLSAGLAEAFDEPSAV